MGLSGERCSFVKKRIEELGQANDSLLVNRRYVSILITGFEMKKRMGLGLGDESKKYEFYLK